MDSDLGDALICMDSAAVPRNPADCRATLLLCRTRRKHAPQGVDAFVKST